MGRFTFRSFFVLGLLGIIQKPLATSEASVCGEESKCYNGVCVSEDEIKKCVCHDCWTGKECDQFVDLHSPRFDKEDNETTVIVSEWSPDVPIHRVKADDQDQLTTCSKAIGPCQCAHVTYHLQDINDHAEELSQLFAIDKDSGDIYLLNSLPDDQWYHFTIVAQGLLDHNKRHSAKVSVYQPAQDSSSSAVIDLPAELRTKRSAEGSENNYQTSFALSLLRGDAKSMEPGNQLDYVLQVTLPQTDAMDLTIEVFTRDFVDTKFSPALTLFDLTIDTPREVAISLDKPHVRKILSDVINNVCERIVVDFGMIRNTRANITLSVKFSVAMVRNAAVQPGKPHYVTAGGEYDNKTYVWVGQSEVVPVRAQLTPPKLDVEVKGPNSASKDSAAIFTFSLFLAVRSENATVQAVTATGGNSLSIGYIGVAEFGKHYAAVPQEPDHYKMNRLESDNNDVFPKSFLDLGLLTNVGPAKQDAKRGENRIQLTMAVYVTPEARVGVQETVSVVIRIGEVKLWSGRLDIAVTPRVNHKLSESLSTTVEADVAAASPGDSVTYTLRTRLAPGSFSEYRVEVLLPNEGERLVPCAAQAVKEESGFNVPFVNSSFVAPVQLDDRIAFHFGRIQVTQQRLSAPAKDDTVEIDIVFRTPAEATNGTRFDVTIFVFTTQDGVPAPLEAPSVVATLKDYQVPAVIVKNAGRWSEMYRGGAVVMNLTATLKPGSSYGDVAVEVMGMNNSRFPELRICRLEVVAVGRALPCLRLDIPQLNSIGTTYRATGSSKEHNYGHVKLGTVSSVQAPPADQDENRVVLQVAATIAEDSTLVKHADPYAISLGMSVGKTAVWTSEVTYTLSTNSPPALKNDDTPIVEAFLTFAGPYKPGQPIYVTLVIQTSPLTIGQYNVFLSSDGDEVDICQLRAQSAGHSLPCVDLTTLATYPRRGTHFGSRQAVITFKALTNVGVIPKSSAFRTPNANSLVMNGVLLTSPKSPSAFNGSVSWSVEFGGGKKLSGTLPVPISANAKPSNYFASTSNAATPGLKSARFYPLSQNIGASAPMPLILELQIDPHFVGALSVSIGSTSHGSPVPYFICNAGLAFKGKNFPCFHPDQLDVMLFSSKNSVNDSVTFDLGVVSNTFVDPTPAENKIQLGLSIRLSEESPALGNEFYLQATASVGGKSLNLDMVNMTTVHEQDNVVNAQQQPGQVTPGSDKSLVLRTRERRWVTFRVTIPPSSLTKVRVTAVAETRDRRALFTLHDLRLAGTGGNIPCSNTETRPVQKSSSGVSTVQVTELTSDLGYFANAGYSHSLNISKPGDDQLVVEVQVEMGDHPSAGSTASLTLKVQMLDSEVEARQALAIQKDGTESPDIEVKMTVDDSVAYKDGDEIELKSIVQLSDKSRSEPSDIVFRLYLPPYVAFDSFSYTGVSSDQEPTLRSDPTSPAIDFHMPFLLFADRVELKILVRVRPTSNHGTNLATTIYRVLCQRGDRQGSCGRMGHVLYRVLSEDCNEALGMEDGRIEDCQLTADTAATIERPPRNARLGSSGVWSPALWSEMKEPCLQVDLLHRTRLSEITLQTPPRGDRRVTKYRLMSSHDAVNWLNASDVMTLVYKGKKSVSRLVEPLETRFVRFVVVEVESADDGELTHVGVKLELFGCYLERNESATCGQDTTWYSDSPDAEGGRHFSVDVSRNIVYYCDKRKANAREGKCYSSSDSGTTWEALPWNIGSVLGYDPVSKSTLAADLRRRAFLSTSDGRRWVVVASQTVNATREKNSFINSQSVPALDARELDEMAITQGKWRATFVGLHSEGKDLPRAMWSGCCSAA